MQLHPQYYFLHNPSAASVVASVAFAGEYDIVTNTGSITVQGQANITSCSLQCAQPCIPQQFTVTFPDADFGDCQACPIKVGFRIVRERSTDFDVSDYLHVTNDLDYVYPVPAAGGAVTGATIAAYFAAKINNSRTQADIHDNWGIVATVASNVLTLVVPCHYNVSLFPLENTGGYTVTIANTVAGQSAKWTIPQMRRMFQKNVNQIPGQDPDISWFENCESVCVLYLKGCYDHCADINLDRSNPVHLHAAGTKVEYVIFLNSNAPGYAAFIAALASAISTACGSLTPIVGSNTPFASDTAANWAAGDGKDITTAGFTFPGTFQLSNGTVSLVVTATSYGDLATNITGDGSTSITAVWNDPELDITGFGAGIITLRQLS